jgi:hypothetical protein
MVGMEHERLRQRTESITFRLPKKILEQLELEARQNNVSENVLVKQILTSYMDWIRFSNGIGILPLTKESFKTVSKNLELQDIDNIVQDLYSLIKNFGGIKFGSYGPIEALESLTSYLQMSNLAFVHLKDQNDHRLMVTHQLGMEWSLILEELFKKIFGEFVGKDNVRIKTSDDSIIASVTLSF